MECGVLLTVGFMRHTLFVSRHDMAWHGASNVAASGSSRYGRPRESARSCTVVSCTAVPQQCAAPDSLPCVAPHQKCFLCRGLQVCHHPYNFVPIYAPDAPARLPPRDLFWYVVSNGARWAGSSVRVRVG